MEDQGRKMMIAVILMIAVWVGWNYLFPPKEPPPNKAAATAGSAAQTPAALPTASPVGVAVTDPHADPTAPPAATTTTAPAVAARGAEQKIELRYANVIATFSSYGGSLVSWKLTDPRYEHDATHGELLPDLTDRGAFAVNFVGSRYVLPAKQEWLGTKISDTEVMYKLSTPELDVEKHFTVIPASYLVRATVSVKIKAGGDVRERLAVSAFEFQDPDKVQGGSSRIQPRVWESSTLRDGVVASTSIKSLLDPAGGPRKELAIQWTGFEHPYLLVGFAPKPVAGTAVEKHTYAFPASGDQKAGLMETDLWFVESTTPSAEVVAYLGPKNHDQLHAADDVAGFPTGFGDVIDLGWFGFIGKILLRLLLAFYSVLGNWGVAIVLLTVLVKAVTVPFATKSMRSMKGMAALGPQIKALNDKYKHDKQRLQLEQMALYKQNNVNPLSGCLPLFLQMPIWLALYRMLSSAGELYQQPFIHGWIDDLTASDPTHVLPIVLVVTMFVQARLTPQNPDPSQRTQQRIMQYGMPLMFGVMSFYFPAGLTLYIFTNTCLSALHSIYMNKFDKPSLEIAAKIDKARAAAAKDASAKDVKDAKDANVKDAADDGDDDDGDGGSDEGAAKGGDNANGRSAQARPKKKKKARR